tara:strand:+ start:521 stop:1339 length:819 start_codon:yes stop_codon:yes gene_type:complete
MPRSIHGGNRNWQPLATHDDMVRIDLSDDDSKRVDPLTLEEEADGDIGCLRSMVIGVYYRFNIGGFKTRRDIHKSKKVCADMLTKVEVKISKTEDRINILEGMLKKQVQNKNRRQAKKYLQQLKRAQKSLAGFTAYKAELDTMVISLDQTEDQTDFVVSFKAARKALSGHSKTLPLADFDDFVDDMEETKADLDEFHNTLAARQEVHYTDIESELDAMFSDDEPSGGKPPDDAEQLMSVASMPLPPSKQIYTPEELDRNAEEQLKILEESTI